MFILKWIARFFGNVIWKLIGGVAGWLLWAAMAIVLTVTIVGFPLAKKFLKIAYAVYKPFGKEVAINAFRFPLANLVWFLTFGLVFGTIALLNSVVFTLSILGIPLAKQWLKVAKLSAFPFGACISR